MSEPGHGTSAYRRRGCRCDICVTAYREKMRRKGQSRRDRGIRKPYSSVSAACRSCGARVNRKHGHRYEQCWNCRAAEDSVARAAAAVANREAEIARRPKCSKCGSALRSNARRAVCADCHRIGWWEATCSGGCGKAMRATASNRNPRCQPCRQPHGTAGWRSGCRCEVCEKHSRNQIVRERSHSRAKQSRRLAELQSATSRRATRSGPYSQYEDEIVLSPNMTAARCATILGRTLNSVQMRRKRLMNPVPYGRRLT